MTTAHQVIYLLLAHFISAFLFQSDVMASQKGKHFAWFMLHAMIYVASLFFIMLLGMVIFENFTWSMVWRFILINAVTYPIIGFTMSSVNAESKERKQHYLLSIGMGFEQLLHVLVLIYSLSYLLEK